MKKEEKALIRQNGVLLRLSRSGVIDDGVLGPALQEITEAAAHGLDVERVGVWFYQDEQNDAMSSPDLFSRSTGEHGTAPVLSHTAFPAYFAELATERALAAHDAHTHPGTAELSEAYLTPLGIGALLDTPIRHHGHMVGIVCHEHVGPARNWSQEDINFAGSMADAVARTLAGVERQEAKEALREANRELENRIEARTQELHAKQTVLEDTLEKLVETNTHLQHEIKEKSRISRELQMAQKLEAVGQLAAGIAHEINTPTHYIGNNVHFLIEAFEDLQTVVSKFKEAYDARADTERCHQLLVVAKKEADTVDIGVLYEEIPNAFTAITEGITTISTIVCAMGNFAHPDSGLKELGDINRAIESTLIVSHFEYRFLATIDSDLEDIPLIPCFLGELNQVFLTIVINAAHAIADAGKSIDTGWIKIRAKADSKSGMLVMTFQDNGCGMDNATQERIFDPFFTTKDVGRGTGQGLTIARDIIVDRHNGHITTESTVGHGTTFTISLPL